MSCPGVKPLFVVVEGVDGVGKTSVVEAARKALEAVGHDTHVVRDMWSTHLGDYVRQMFLGEDHPKAVKLALAHAVRAVIACEEVQPKLESNVTVVSDRWYYSSFAYNVDRDDIDGAILFSEMAASIDKLCRTPDLLIYVEPDSVDKSFARAMASTPGKDVFMESGVELQRNAIAQYEHLLGFDLGPTEVLCVKSEPGDLPHFEKILDFVRLNYNG